MYGLWLLLHDRRTLKSLRQRPYGLQSLKYLPSDPLQKLSADLCFKGLLLSFIRCARDSPSLWQICLYDWSNTVLRTLLDAWFIAVIALWLVETHIPGRLISGACLPAVVLSLSAWIVPSYTCTQWRLKGDFLQNSGTLSIYSLYLLAFQPHEFWLFAPPEFSTVSPQFRKTDRLC